MNWRRHWFFISWKRKIDDKKSGKLSRKMYESMYGFEQRIRSIYGWKTITLHLRTTHVWPRLDKKLSWFSTDFIQCVLLSEFRSATFLSCCDFHVFKFIATQLRSFLASSSLSFVVFQLFFLSFVASQPRFHSALSSLSFPQFHCLSTSSSLSFPQFHRFPTSSS